LTEEELVVLFKLRTEEMISVDKLRRFAGVRTKYRFIKWLLERGVEIYDVGEGPQVFLGDFIRAMRGSRMDDKKHMQEYLLADAKKWDQTRRWQNARNRRIARQGALGGNLS
jgi:hypothetical protein